MRGGGGLAFSLFFFDEYMFQRYALKFVSLIRPSHIKVRKIAYDTAEDFESEGSYFLEQENTLIFGV